MTLMGKALSFLRRSPGWHRPQEIRVEIGGKDYDYIYHLLTVMEGAGQVEKKKKNGRCALFRLREET